VAKTVEQQIAEEKKRLALIAKTAADAAAAANASKAAKASGLAMKNKINEYQARLDYINTRLAPYIKKLAKGEKLTSTEKSIFDGLSGQFNSLKKEITTIKFPGALGPTGPKSSATGAPTGTQAQRPAPAPEPAPATTTTPATRPSTGTTGGGTTGGGTTGGGGATGGGTTGGAGQAVPSNFNVGTFRKADEASMTGTDGVTPPVAETPLDTLLAKTEFWYDLPDYIFKLDKKLGDLLVKAVKEGWDNKKFLAAAELTPWWQKNSSAIRTRIVDRAKYDELKAAGEDVSKSDYGLYLSKQMRSVKAKAKEIAGVTLTDEQAQSVAQKIYDGFLDDDPLAINALITPFIGKTTSIVGTGLGGKQTGFSGQALQNYQTLQGIAKANGFSLKDILPNISAVTAGGDLETAVLRGLANGDIDINRVAQDARMLAAQGQPQYVRDLLGQGYDLENIYAPYRQTMASVLEIDPNQIDLNDSTLRMAITDKGDMNLYDFKKALRQDNRWQYTSAAKEEVSNAALRVLQDFGFQG
jgi:hypothetical protein